MKTRNTEKIIISELVKQCGSGSRDPVLFRHLDPESSAFLTPGSKIRDGKKSGSGIQDEHTRSNLFSESLVTFLGLKILKNLDADPGTEICFTLDPECGTEKFGSGINIPDPRKTEADLLSTKSGSSSSCSSGMCCLANLASSNISGLISWISQVDDEKHTTLCTGM